MRVVAATFPRWADTDGQHILLTVTFDGQEPMPFQATRGAAGVSGEIFAMAESGDFGPVENYTPPPVDADAVGAECRRRIYAIASQNAQMNMTAFLATPLATAADRAAFARAFGWVQDMRAAYAAIIEGNDHEFRQDDRWPPCPHEVIAFATRF